MASIWQRLSGKVVETRAAQPTIPSRATTIVTPETALSLTAVYRAVQIIATPISKMNIETFRYATGLGDVKIENPLLVNKPSLQDSRRDFFYETVVSMATTGEAFWYKSFDGQGRVNNLTVLPSSAVGVNLNEARTAKLYFYEGKDVTGRIEHLRLFAMPGELRGRSPIGSAYKDVAAALDLRDYAVNWFGSAGVPTGVLKTSQQLNSEQAEAVTANWHNKQQNRQVAVLGNGFEYQQVSLSPKDALFTEVQDQAVQTIARLMGVPARLLLTTVSGGSDTYSNLSDENQVFYRHTLTGYTDAIADGLSNCLPRGTRVEFNFESLFKADQASRFNMWNTALSGEAFMTVEEVRAKEGL